MSARVVFAMTEQQAAILVALFVRQPAEDQLPDAEPRTWTTLQARGLVDASRKLTQLGEAAAWVAWQLNPQGSFHLPARSGAVCDLPR